MKKNLKDLLKHEVKDLYSGETQLMEALPKMAKAASNDKLQKPFQDHWEETKSQKDRLEKVAQMLGIDPTGEHCDAMEGLIEEGDEMVNMDAEDAVKDAGLIAAAQRVEHYEIAGYGSACRYAEMLNEKNVLNLLQETLSEEKSTDNKLTKLAESEINEEAMA